MRRWKLRQIRHKEACGEFHADLLQEVNEHPRRHWLAYRVVMKDQAENTTDKTRGKTRGAALPLPDQGPGSCEPGPVVLWLPQKKLAGIASPGSDVCWQPGDSPSEAVARYFGKRGV